MKEILLAGDTNRLVAELTFVSGATNMVRFVVVWGWFSQIHYGQHHLDSHIFVLEDRQKCFGMMLTLSKAKADDANKVSHYSYSATIVIISRSTTSIIRSESKTSRSWSAFVAVMSEQMNECFKPWTVLDQVEAEEAFVVSIHIFTFRCHYKEVDIIDGPSDRQ